MKYETIGIVGAGVIGASVAQNIAQTGHRVVLVDLSTELLERARARIVKSLKCDALFDSALREASHSSIVDQIELTTDYIRLAQADLVIENATESWSVKRAIYPQLDRLCGQGCILAANTSAIPIERLAGTTTRPDRVIGMHFMNPVPHKSVVELIKSRHTSAATVDAAKTFLGEIGKKAIVVKDRPGFVSNRVLMLAINEAILVVQEDVATPYDVDQIFTKCFAHKMGPLATADLIGLDTVLLSLEALHESYNDAKFCPCKLLRDMVDAGLHGRKSGRGFFDYTDKQDD